MFLVLNNLTWKQWIIYNVIEKSIYIVKLILPDKWYIFLSDCVIKLISNNSRSFIMKNIITLCPPPQILQVSTLFYKIKNLLTR
jgi:hypothetical protein